MVRTLWIAASLLTATLTAAGGQPGEPTTDSSAKAGERLVTMQEQNRPAQVCRILMTWRMPNGLQAHDMLAVATGERLTVVEDHPLESHPSAGQRAVATQTYRWTRDGKRPAGCPMPPSEPVAPAVAGRPQPTARPAPITTSVYAGKPMPAQSKAQPAAHAGKPAPITVGNKPISVEPPAKPLPTVSGIQRVSAEVIAAPVEKPAPAVLPDAVENCDPPCEEECRPGRRPSLLGSLRRPKADCDAIICDDCPPASKPKLLSRLRKHKEEVCVSKPAFPHGVPTAVKMVPADTRVNMPTEPPNTVINTWDKPKLRDRFSRKKCDEECVGELKPAVEPIPYMPPAINGPEVKPVEKPKVTVEPAQPGDWRQSWGKTDSLPAVPVKPEKTEKAPVAKVAEPKKAETPAVAAAKTDEPKKPTPRLPDPEELRKDRDPLLNPDRYLRPPVAETEAATVPSAPQATTAAKPVEPTEAEPKQPIAASVAAAGTPYHGVVPNLSAPVAAAPFGPPPPAPNPNINSFRGQPVCTPPRGMANAFTVPGVQQPIPSDTYVGNQSVNAFSGPDGPFVPGGALAGPQPCCPPALGPCASPGPGLGTYFVPANGYPMPGMPMGGMPMMPGMPMPGMSPDGQMPMPGGQPTLPQPTPGGPAPTLPFPMPGQPMPAPAAQSSAGPQGEMVAQLVQMLKSSDYPSQREWAADQLASMGLRDQAIAAALVASAKEDPAAMVRTGSIRALTSLSARNPTVIAALQQLHKDADPRVREAAGDALTAFGASPTAPASTIQPVSGQSTEKP